MALNPFYNRNLFPIGFEEFFAPTPFLLPRHPAFDLVPRDFGDGWIRSSPGYSMSEVDGKYSINVDLPGVKASDVKVELEHEGTVLHISGGRKIKTDKTREEVHFDRRFTIGDNVDTEKMTANLADGVLTLTAPKKEQVKPQIRSIPITEAAAADKK
jgi:HSP20 family protein